MTDGVTPLGADRSETGGADPGPPYVDAQQEFASLGAQLRAVREAAGRTVEQVSESTRIRSSVVRDLEADRFGSSGGSIYARGHVRNLAKAVGADPTPFVLRYDREVDDAALPVIDAQPVLGPDMAPADGRHLPPVGRPARRRTGRGPGAEPAKGGRGGASTRLTMPTASRPERRGPNWLGAAVVAVGLLVVLVAIGSLNGTPRGTTDAAGTTGNGAKSGTPGTGPSPRGPSPQPSAAVQPPPPDAVAERPPASGAELRVRILGGSSWISVRGGSKTLFEGVLRDGQFKDFKDRKTLKLVVGNAGAVNLVCGGKDVGQAGNSGSVKRFTCSANGLVGG